MPLPATFEVKESNDPDFEAKKNRVLELYDIADGKAEPQLGRVVICMDEFGPLNLQPHPGKQWAAAAATELIPTGHRGVDDAPPSPGPMAFAT